MPGTHFLCLSQAHDERVVTIRFDFICFHLPSVSQSFFVAFNSLDLCLPECPVWPPYMLEILGRGRLFVFSPPVSLFFALKNFGLLFYMIVSTRPNKIDRLSASLTRHQDVSSLL